MLGFIFGSEELISLTPPALQVCKAVGVFSYSLPPDVVHKVLLICPCSAMSGLFLPIVVEKACEFHTEGPPQSFVSRRKVQFFFNVSVGSEETKVADTEAGSVNSKSLILFLLSWRAYYNT